MSGPVVERTERNRSSAAIRGLCFVALKVSEPQIIRRSSSKGCGRLTSSSRRVPKSEGCSTEEARNPDPGLSKALYECVHLQRRQRSLDIW
jgi:hypothetical protein